MDFLPLFFNLQQQPCLLVGGGAEALRKARLLTRAGAIVHLVDPTPEIELITLIRASGGSHSARDFTESDLDGSVLVVVAIDAEATAAAIAAAAKQRQIPVNVVDTPALCTFIMPAIIDRSPLVIAVSSGGEAPVLARQTRTRLERLIPASYGKLAAFASRWRDTVRSQLDSGDQRRRFWEQVLEGPIAEQVFAGREQEADACLIEALAAADPGLNQGEVYLVGAGPGDPELLTLKALRLMQQAEIVLYDQRVSAAVLDLVRRDADRIAVGKTRDHAIYSQSDINAKLIELARAGKRVLRLKGGDPFLFGRGHEELQALADARIPVQLVPGITAANASSLYAGIPLTHRGIAHSVRFIGGPYQAEVNHQTGRTRSDIFTGPDLSRMTDPGETLVFYMGRHALQHIADQLLLAGRAPTTPAALICNGTQPDQQVVITSLAALQTHSDLAAQSTLLIIGDVVTLSSLK